MVTQRPARGTTRGFERYSWQIADALRHSVDAAQYQVVLGLIILKYISPAFEEQRAKLEEGADSDLLSQGTSR